MGDALHLKCNDESLYFAIVLSFTSTIQIRSQEKSGSIEESHDKEKCELVVGRVAYEDQVTENPDRCGCWASEFSRQVGRRGGGCNMTQDEMERSFTHGASTGFFFGKRQEEESSKRESDIMLLAGELVGVEKIGRTNPAIRKQGLRHLRKVRDEEKGCQRISWRKCRKEGCKWRTRCGKSLKIKLPRGTKRRSESLNAQIWQLVQIRNTKAENLEHDFSEIADKIWELGWSDGKRVTRSWVETEEEEEIPSRKPGCLMELLLVFCLVSWSGESFQVSGSLIGNISNCSGCRRNDLTI